MAILIIAALLAPACAAPPGRGITAMEAVPSGDPCDGVLTSQRAARFADAGIRTLQERARDATNPVPYLERMGWGWIARERVLHDHQLLDLALETAACMEARRPGSAEALLLRAHALVSMHRFKEGEGVARALVKESGSWLGHAILGDALMEQGRVEEAAAHYQRMADQNPGPHAWSRAAHLRWLLGDREGAVEAMERAARAVDRRDLDGAAWYRGRLAQYALEAGRPDEARRWIDAALLLVPDHPPALHARGLLLLSEGRAAGAVAALQAAVGADPLPEYLWALHDALVEAGRDRDAAAIESRLLAEGEREDPRAVALYLASNGKDPERALRLALRELEVRQDPLTLDAVALAMLAGGRVAEAGDYVRRALALGTRAPRLALHAAMIAAAMDGAAAAAPWMTDAAATRGALLPSERRRLERLEADLIAAIADRSRAAGTGRPADAAIHPTMGARAYYECPDDDSNPEPERRLR